MNRRTNSNMQITSQKTKDRAKCKPSETGDELGWSGRVVSLYSTSGIRHIHVTLATKRVIV